MKKSVEILGLPIISITEGRELGISKSLLIDAQNGSVAALIIEDEDWFRGVKLLPYDSVIAIGDDAITITNSENILKLAEATDYEPLLNQNVRVIGTKAITKAGSIQGVVSEIVIGESGKIAKCTIATENETDTKDIAAEQISIFGKQVTIIDCELPEEAQLAQKKTKSAAPVKTAAPVEEKTVVEVAAPEAAPAPVESPAEEKVETKEAAPEEKAEVKAEVKAEPEKAPAAAPEPVKAPENQAKQLSDKAVEERHRRFLLGKKAARRIATDNGIVIVEAGADITEEVLQKAKLANKFIELSMNVQ